MNRKIIESFTGILILLFSGACVFYAYDRSQMCPRSNQYSLKAEFESADGIKEGSPVKINGVKIGSVTSMLLDQKKYSVIVSFAISNRFHIPKDSSAAIVTDGLFGAKFMSISPGVESELLCKNATIHNTSSPVDLSRLFQQYLFKSSEPSPAQSASQESNEQPEKNYDQEDSEDEQTYPM